MELHCVKVQLNVQESASQYFVLILLSAKVYNTYISAGNYSAMYYSCLSLLCIYFTMSHNALQYCTLCCRKIHRNVLQLLINNLYFFPRPIILCNTTYFDGGNYSVMYYRFLVLFCALIT